MRNMMFVALTFIVVSGCSSREISEYSSLEMEQLSLENLCALHINKNLSLYEGPLSVRKVHDEVENRGLTLSDCFEVAVMNNVEGACDSYNYAYSLGKDKVSVSWGVDMDIHQFKRQLDQRNIDCGTLAYLENEVRKDRAGREPSAITQLFDAYATSQRKKAEMYRQSVPYNQPQAIQDSTSVIGDGCRRIGSRTYCDDSSYRHVGDRTYGSDGSVYRHSVNKITDDKGNVWVRSGDIVRSPDGTTYRLSGDYIYGPEETCRVYGSNKSRVSCD